MSEPITDPIEQLASRCEVPVEWLKQWAEEYGVRLTVKDEEPKLNTRGDD